MSDPRYVIAAVLTCDGGLICGHDYDCIDEYEPVLDLPDAEHVHVTRLPDGTITATPMREVREFIATPDGVPFAVLYTPAWVDCPTGGDQ